MDCRDILLPSEAEKPLNRGNVSRESYVIELWFYALCLTETKACPLYWGLLSSTSEKPQTPIWAITVSHGSLNGVTFSSKLFLKSISINQTRTPRILLIGS